MHKYSTENTRQWRAGRGNMKALKRRMLKDAAKLTDGFVCHVQHAADDVTFLPHFAVSLGTLVPFATLQQYFTTNASVIAESSPSC